MVHVSNIVPSKFFSIQTVIPPGASEYNQVFTNSSLNLSDKNTRYLITRVTAIIDTAGIYNIATEESLTINGVATTIKPGFYRFYYNNTPGENSIENLMSCATFPDGPYAFKPYVFGTSAGLPVVYGPQVASILGLYPGVTYLTKGSYSGLRTQIPSGNNAVNVTAKYDTISIGCDLVDLASTVSPNYILMAGITASDSSGNLGGVISRSSSTMIPVTRKSLSSIIWRLFDRDGAPLTIFTPLVIHLEISGWDL